MSYRIERDRNLQRLGANIRRLRAARGLSQERFAERSALHRTEIGRLELGLVEPRLSTLLILADSLGVAIDELVAGLVPPIERKLRPSARRRQLRR